MKSDECDEYNKKGINMINNKVMNKISIFQ